MRIIRTAASLAILLAIAACNTVQGVGEDISSVGKKGEEVLKDAQK